MINKYYKLTNLSWENTDQTFFISQEILKLAFEYVFALH